MSENIIEPDEVVAAVEPPKSRKKTGVAKREPAPGDLLAVIAQAVADPRMDVAKMEKLLAMHERIVADQRETAFVEAMARLQAKLPQIDKHGRIVVNGQERSRYARLEDIDVAIRPLLAEEGFSFSFDEESIGEHGVTFIGILSHREGHSRTKRRTVPVDKAATGQKGPVRTPIQDAGSTTSYARRYLLKMHLNLVEREEDNDGNDLETITNDQVLDIKALIESTASDEKKFLELIAGVDKIENIPVRDFKRCINALEQKARTRK